MKALILLLLTIFCLSGASIDHKIKEKQAQLRTTNRQISGLNLRLERLSKSIRKLEGELERINQRLQELDGLVARLNQEHKEKFKQYEETQKRIEELHDRYAALKEKLIQAISKSFSQSLLLASIGEGGEEDLLKEEILKTIQKREDRNLSHISKRYEATKRELRQKKELLAKLKGQIDELIKKRQELKALKRIKSKKLKKLAAQKRRYKEELQRLTQQRQALTKTLQELKIIKSRRTASRSASKVRVKKYGGYKKDRTVRYRGPKTIPPLKQFVITKRYGVYVDPIYKIKIPNENIELKPLKPNAKVRNVLNGRVILAKWTPHLKNVVIVKHDNNLYTIYANMDRLSPFIKKGKRIKKGYIIGRVNNKLIFEVTKNSAHIDPLDLIQAR
ncbi:MAG: hypothetical protein C6I00_02570 [Nitratiruptor sp.]|nr:hypothetical protein [Nitratiruptor sp.]NPA84170.1 peptidoglycan DD-metalloendopeptidase family protein [Campylobacterota bacterium]